MRAFWFGFLAAGLPFSLATCYSLCEIPDPSLRYSIGRSLPFTFQLFYGGWMGEFWSWYLIGWIDVLECFGYKHAGGVTNWQSAALITFLMALPHFLVAWFSGFLAWGYWEHWFPAAISRKD